MTWKDNLLPGSWRGIEFKIVSSRRSGGRRAVVHEFPHVDDPFVQDTGRKPEQYSIDALLIGDDYMLRRDRLVRWLREKPDRFLGRPGSKLVHPYWGTIEVVPVSWEVKEAAREGRLCRVAMTFQEVGLEPQALEVEQDAALSVDDQAAAVELAAGDQVVSELVVEGVPEPARTAVSDQTASFAGQLQASLGKLTGPQAAVQELAANAVELLQSATALATAPADLVAQAKISVQGVLAAAESSLEAFYVYETLFGFEAATLGGAGSTSGTANLNSKLVANLFAAGVAANAARAAVRASWSTRSDAVDARDSLLREIERILLIPELDDRTARGMRRVAALVAAGVPQPGQDLPELRTLQLGSSEPGLVVAWRLYGDAGRSEEIADRNQLPYPALLPGGAELEVLSG